MFKMDPSLVIVGGQMVTATEVSRDKLRDADWVNKK